MIGEYMKDIFIVWSLFNIVMILGLFIKSLLQSVKKLKNSKKFKQCVTKKAKPAPVSEAQEIIEL